MEKGTIHASNLWHTTMLGRQQVKEEGDGLGYLDWMLLLWSDIFIFCSKSRDLRTIKKMIVFFAKKLLLDSEITSLEFNILKDQSNPQKMRIEHTIFRIQWSFRKPFLLDGILHLQNCI